MWDIQLFKLNYDEKEVIAVQSVLESGWITMGEMTKNFERSFSDYLGGEATCNTVSSCTAALHLSLLVAGVGNGDEVVIPALTFVAAANVVLHCGATPVLADVSSSLDWNVSFEAVKNAATDKTRVVMVVHFAGYPCRDIERIAEFCRQKKIILIEDVAHAPGAEIYGKKCGLFGDFGCFSFFTNKNLSVGEGGMVATTNENFGARISALRSHGMSLPTLDRYRGRAETYDVKETGLNYRIDEMRAAIGLVQLKKLPNANEKRRLLTLRYKEKLRDLNLTIPFVYEKTDYKPVHHIMPVLLNEDQDRMAVIEKLKSSKIQTSIHYPSMKKFTGLQEKIRGDCPLSEIICRNELTLPLYPDMKINDVDKVCNSLRLAL